MTKAKGKGLCPICGRPAVAEHRPFCSARCADVDLHRWLGGVYALPATETDDDGEAPAVTGADDGIE